MAKLTVRGIEALKPKDTGYKVTADRGLYLRVCSFNGCGRDCPGPSGGTARAAVKVRRRPAGRKRPRGRADLEGEHAVAA